VVELLESINAAAVFSLCEVARETRCDNAERVTVAVLRLEAGNFSIAKGAGAGIFELRLDFGPGYRMYFGKDGEQLVILLGGGTKKRQQSDIEASLARIQADEREAGERWQTRESLAIR